MSDMTPRDRQDERDLRRLMAFLRSPQVSDDPELEWLTNNDDLTLAAARERLRLPIRQVVVHGLVAGANEQIKAMRGAVGHVVSGTGMGRRIEALNALRAHREIGRVLAELLGHAAMLDPDQHIEPDQGDLVEEARKATRPTISLNSGEDNSHMMLGDNDEGPRIKSVAQVARPQAFPGGKVAAAPASVTDNQTAVDAFENSERAQGDRELLKPIITRNKMALRVWEKKIVELCDFYEVDTSHQLPEHARRSLIAEIVERFGNAEQKAAWERIVATRDGSTAC